MCCQRVEPYHDPSSWLHAPDRSAVELAQINVRTMELAQISARSADANGGGGPISGRGGRGGGDVLPSAAAAAKEAAEHPETYK